MSNKIVLYPSEVNKLLEIIKEYPNDTISISTSSTSGIGVSTIVVVAGVVRDITDYSIW